jgi:hypothetical protein
MTAKISTFLAAAGVISPWWLPYVAPVSAVAAALLPIFSLAWLIIQIWAFFEKRKKGQ